MKFLFTLAVMVIGMMATAQINVVSRQFISHVYDKEKNEYIVYQNELANNYIKITSDEVIVVCQDCETKKHTYTITSKWETSKTASGGYLKTAQIFSVPGGTEMLISQGLNEAKKLHTIGLSTDKWLILYRQLERL